MLVTIQESQSIKIFLGKTYVHDWFRGVFISKKLIMLFFVRLLCLLYCFFIYFIYSRIFSVANLSDLKSRFVVWSQLSSSIQSDSFPFTGLQVVTQSVYLVKDFCHRCNELTPLRLQISWITVKPLHPAIEVLYGNAAKGTSYEESHKK